MDVTLMNTRTPPAMPMLASFGFLLKQDSGLLSCCTWGWIAVGSSKKSGAMYTPRITLKNFAVTHLDVMSLLRRPTFVRLRYVLCYSTQILCVLTGCCFQKDIEAETIRLDSQDGQSTKEWVHNLEKRGELLGFKGSSDVPPAGSALAPDTFALCVQTKYQRECWNKWGGKFAGLDATHNTTHYQGMSLFTVIVRDKWGHGTLLNVNTASVLC